MIILLLLAFYILIGIVWSERTSCGPYTWCYYQNIYPSSTVPTTHTISIQNADDGVATYFEIYFTPKTNACRDPSISFTFEEIDFSSNTTEYLQVFNGSLGVNLLSTCYGTQDANCNYWRTCLSNYTLGILSIDADSTHQLTVKESFGIDDLCTAYHKYSINANLTLQCDGTAATTPLPTPSPFQIWINATFDTTDAVDDDRDKAPVFVLFYMSLIMMAIILVYGFLIKTMCHLCNVCQERLDWNTLSDFHEIKSNFKSIKSVKMYISNQSVNRQMVISIILLIVAIFVNTYTNYRNYWHYHQEYVDDTNQSIILGATGPQYMAVFEFMISIVMLSLSIIYLIFKKYIRSVQFMIVFAPNISMMFYFMFLNTKLIKTAICNAWRPDKTFISKLLRTAATLLILSNACLIGLWVFVVKVKQITYIYGRDLETLSWSDFIVVFGIARQFATLVSITDGLNCFGFVFTMIHPSKRKGLAVAQYDIDKVVCKEVINQYGIVFGYCWLCYTFGDLDNVKKLYLQKLDDEHSLISMADQTHYVQMVDK